MDIDIDISPKYIPAKLFPNAIPASRIEKNELLKHPVGIYFQRIATDPITKLAAIPYDQAENHGYFKIDFINNLALNSFSSKDEMNALLEKEPNWTLLDDINNVNKLFHIAGHFELIDKIKPKSILEIADVIAFIRPHKFKILNSYLKNKKMARKELYTIRDKSHMKKSHALAYALLVVLQLHLIEQDRL